MSHTAFSREGLVCIELTTTSAKETRKRNRDIVERRSIFADVSHLSQAHLAQHCNKPLTLKVGRKVVRQVQTAKIITGGRGW